MKEKMSIKITVLLCSLGLLLASCTMTETKPEASEEKKPQAAASEAKPAKKSAAKAVAKATHGEEKMHGPELVDSNGKDYFVYKNKGRVFVVGTTKMNEMFKKHGHLPYTKTILGAGPMGETVVFEVDKEDPAHAERLVETYTNTPHLLASSGDDYNVYKFKSRIYVVGQKEMNMKFKKLHHLPYTKTILGAGPKGETVVFQVDKKKPELVNRLVDTYNNTPKLMMSSGNDYYVYKLKGRIYVIGQESMNKKFMKHGHLPYTKTILGAGPNGETVVFEVDKKKPEMADNLVKRYRGQ